MTLKERPTESKWSEDALLVWAAAAAAVAAAEVAPMSEALAIVLGM
jgi:hypothetical protein